MFQPSCFEWEAPQFQKGSSCPLIFELILAGMSDIFEFFKSVTFFINMIWKSWLLVMKLGACIDAALYHEQ